MHFSDDEFYIETLSPTHQRCLKLRSRIYAESSDFQRIEIVDTYDYGKTLILDGAIQATERDTFIYHEVLAHPPLLMQEQPTCVLVIGGGDGGILAELLKHQSVKRVVVVEIDGMVVEVSRKYLPEICKNAWGDPRTELHIADGRKFIEESRENFDAIILDLTDPIGPSKSLYTREAYGSLADRLTGTGIIATHAGGWFHYPKVTGSVVATLRSVFRYVAVFPANVPSYGMEIAFAYASASVDVGSFPGKTFAVRYAELAERAGMDYVTGDFVERIALQPRLMQEHVRSWDKVSTDDEPLEFSDYYAWG